MVVGGRYKIPAQQQAGCVVCHKMTRRISILLLIVIGSLSCVGQTNKFEELVDKIFFKIMSYQSDSTTLKFIKKFVPQLATKPKPGGWTVYPPNMDTTPRYLVLHSLYFTKHPYLDFNFREGRLDIFTQERFAKLAGLYDIDIWLMFDKIEDANLAFDKLTKLFGSASTTKNIFQGKSKTIASFEDSTSRRFPNSIQFVLTQDELYDNKYKIFFHETIDPMLTENYGTQH